MGIKLKFNEIFELHKDDIGDNRKDRFFELVERADIICPQPELWNNFWKKFIWPKKGNFLMPFILSGWWGTDDDEKNQRFKEQIDFIKKNNDETIIFEFFQNYELYNEWSVSGTSLDQNLLRKKNLESGFDLYE